MQALGFSFQRFMQSSDRTADLVVISGRVVIDCLCVREQQVGTLLAGSVVRGCLRAGACMSVQCACVGILKPVAFAAALAWPKPRPMKAKGLIDCDVFFSLYHQIAAWGCVGGERSRQAADQVIKTGYARD